MIEGLYEKPDRPSDFLCAVEHHLHQMSTENEVRGYLLEKGIRYYRVEQHGPDGNDNKRIVVELNFGMRLPFAGYYKVTI